MNNFKRTAKTILTEGPSYRNEYCDPNDTICFRNEYQVGLFKHELSGQLSDGYWENSKPMNHWKRPCNAKLVVAPGNLGTNWFVTKKYNFAAPVQYVGDRMLLFCKLMKAGFKDEEIDNLETAIDSLTNGQTLKMDDPKAMERFISNYSHTDSKYYAEKYELCKKILKADTPEEYFEAVKKILAVQFTMQGLRKELKDMSDIYNNMKSK